LSLEILSKSSVDISFPLISACSLQGNNDDDDDDDDDNSDDCFVFAVNQKEDLKSVLISLIMMVLLLQILLGACQ